MQIGGTSIPAHVFAFGVSADFETYGNLVAINGGTTSQSITSENDVATINIESTSSPLNIVAESDYNTVLKSYDISGLTLAN